MNVHRFFCPASVVLALFVFSSASSAQIFYTETFDYNNGDLTAVSGGLWAAHADGGSIPIQVVDGRAVVVAGTAFSEDVNRLTGVVMGTTDIWYYAVKFNVEQFEMSAINNDYFIHLKDATTFGFNARLATSAPADMANDFSFQIWASSGGDGMTDWDGDFLFGEEIVCVVRWDNGTGVATLWVNPDDENSTNISDDELPDAMRMIESVALRQDSTDGSVVNVDTVSVGTDFDAVLEAVCPTGGQCDFDLGDVNQDGEVDFLDIQPFVDVLNAMEFQCEADVNQDTVVDFLDIQPFVDLLS